MFGGIHVIASYIVKLRACKSTNIQECPYACTLFIDIIIFWLFLAA